MAQALLGGYHAVPGHASSLVFNGIACLISTPAQWWEMAGWHSEALCITSPGQSRAGALHALETHQQLHRAEQKRLRLITNPKDPSTFLGC